MVRKSFAALSVLLLTSLARPPRAAGQRKLSLAEAITIAKRQRSESRQADIDVERAQLGLLRARLEQISFNIQTSASAQWQRLNLNAPSSACMVPSDCPTDAHAFSGSATLTVPLWSGLRISADIDRAHALQDQAEADRRKTARSLALEAAEAYWAVRRAELLYELTKKALVRTKAMASLAQEHVKAGISPIVDYNRFEVLVLTREEQLAQLEGQVIKARADFALALQLEGDVVLTDAPDRYVASVPQSDNAAFRQALASRPDVASVRAQQIAEEAAVRSAQGGYWPQISLMASAETRNQYFPPTGSPQTEAVTLDLIFGVQAQWVIFDTLSTWTSVRDASYVSERAREDWRRIHYMVAAEVQGARALLLAAVHRREVIERSVALAQQNLEMLAKRYRVGGAIIIELLDADSSLFQAESDLLDSQVGIATGDAELKNATGSL